MAVNSLVFLLVAVFLSIHGSLANTCGPTITDTYDDIALTSGFAEPLTYNGLIYSHGWSVHAGNPWQNGPSFAHSPPNVIDGSAWSGDPRIANNPNLTIAIAAGYFELKGLYFGCLNSNGAVPCSVGISGFDVNGAQVPVYIYRYEEPHSSTSLIFAAPREGPAIKFVTAIIRVVSSADAPWTTSLLVDSLVHVNCVGGPQITATVTTLYPVASG
ncbi:hypothetical protein LTR42_005351 [Elasticomyces elasticus]|nr:hypothetical protein LTR42_005351 [Elasticomyces elasticus]